MEKRVEKQFLILGTSQIQAICHCFDRQQFKIKNKNLTQRWHIFLQWVEKFGFSQNVTSQGLGLGELINTWRLCKKICFFFSKKIFWFYGIWSCFRLVNWLLKLNVAKEKLRIYLTERSRIEKSYRTIY